MSSNFWHDVRQFHHLLNLAHDGVLTSTELTVTFPKVLEGTFGLRGTQLSPSQYKDVLEAYLNRLYSGAYPEYFLRKLGQTTVHNNNNNNIITNTPRDLNQLPPDPRETRNQLPLLLPHFEQDFITGLSKEEEAVLQVDLTHSIKTLQEYYKHIDRSVEYSIDKFLPVLIKGLTNTTYLPEPTDSLKVIDLELHLDDTKLKMEVLREEPDEKDFEKVLKLTKAHVPVAGIRVLIAGLCGLLYDCPKVKTMTRSAIEEPLKSIFATIPDFFQPGHIAENIGADYSDPFTAMQMLGISPSSSTSSSPPPQSSQPQHQPGEGQMLSLPAEHGPNRSLVMKFAGSQTTTTVTTPVDPSTSNSSKYPSQQQSNTDQQPHKLQQHLGLSPLEAKNLPEMSSDTMNIVWKYIIYSHSHQKYLQFLLSNKGTVYNPLIDDSTTQITEASCNDPKKSEKEREVLKKIRIEQLGASEKSRESKSIPIIQSFSLRSLLNVIFRLFSHTFDITRSIVAINDYIGEITYGEEEEDDMALAQEAMMSMMIMNGDNGAAAKSATPGPSFERTQKMQDSMQNFLALLGGGRKEKTGPIEPPTTGTTANLEETVQLMNPKWLFPVRASINWPQAFVLNQLVSTGGPSQRQMMLMGKLGQGTASKQDIYKVGALEEEDVMVDRLSQYDMATHMRSRKE